MGPEQVRVGVDHLRLDPEAELHPPVPDVADQRAEPVRPDGLVHVPVAEPGGVVPAVPEPAVVEHEPLHPGLGGEIGQPYQPVQVVVEVHRLPDVERRRPGAARVLRPGPQPAVEGGRDPVQPGPAVRGAQLRRRVLLPRREDDLAGQQQLAAAEPGHAAGGALGVADRVAAPGDVHGPHLAGAEAEPRCAGAQADGGVVAGAAGPVLPDPAAHRQPVPLRAALPAPVPGEVEQLAGPVRDRQGGGEPVELVRLAAGVREHVPEPQQPGRGQLDLGAQGQPGVRVGGRQHHPPGPAPGHRRRPEQRREGPAAAGAGQSRPARVAARVRGQQRDRHRQVERPPRHGRHRRGDQFVHSGPVQLAEVGSPVRHGHRPGAAGVQQQAGAGRPQVHEAAGVGRGHPLLAPSVRPPTNCLCSSKNTSTVGSAMITEPAASRL